MNEKCYNQADLQEALRVLREGGIILYPTDTIWGIGCDATNSKAVKRIYTLKRRTDSKAMLVLLDSEDKIPVYADTGDRPSTNLPELDVQRPVTMIFSGARNVAAELIAEDGSLGIRITREPFSQALCAGLGKPLVSTSANISGEPAAGTFAEISEAIKQGVDYICHYRREDNAPKQPSMIIKINNDNTYTIIRP